MTNNDNNTTARVTLEDPYCNCHYPIPHLGAVCLACDRLVWLEACAADWNAARAAELVAQAVS